MSECKIKDGSVWSRTPGLCFLDVYGIPSPQGDHQKFPLWLQSAPSGNSALTTRGNRWDVFMWGPAEQLVTSADGGTLGLLVLEYHGCFVPERRFTQFRH